MLLFTIGICSAGILHAKFVPGKALCMQIDAGIVIRMWLKDGIAWPTRRTACLPVLASGGRYKVAGDPEKHINRQVASCLCFYYSNTTFVRLNQTNRKDFYDTSINKLRFHI